jgi:MFS family permease
LGNVFGTVVTWPLCGLLIETVGWVWAFYVPAIVCIVLALVWFYVVSDSPATHKRISPKEVEYIETSLGTSVSKGKVKVPIITSSSSISNFLFLFTEFPARIPTAYFVTILGSAALALRQFVGSLLPDHRRAQVHFGGAGFQHRQGRYTLEFAISGSIQCWIRVWVNW